MVPDKVSVPEPDLYSLPVPERMPAKVVSELADPTVKLLAETMFKVTLPSELVKLPTSKFEESAKVLEPPFPVNVNDGETALLVNPILFVEVPNNVILGLEPRALL